MIGSTRVHLNGDGSNHNGPIFIAAEARLIYGTARAISRSSVVTISGGQGVLELEVTVPDAEIGSLAGSGVLRMPIGTTLSPGFNNQDAMFSGILLAPSDFLFQQTFRKVGSGTQTFNGLFGGIAYNGRFVIDDGTLRLSGLFRTNRSNAVHIGASGTLDLNGVSQEIASLTGSGRIVSGGGTLSFGHDNANTSFGGTLVDNGLFEKNGTGTSWLTGDSGTFVGDVRVNAGTLALVRGALSAVQVDVQPGGRFELAGGVLNVDTINGDLFHDGGTLSAGNSPGTMRINGDYWLSNLGSLSVELAGVAQGSEYDFYDVTGNVYLSGGTLDIELIPPHTLDLGQTYDILRVGGLLAGRFDGLDEGALLGTFGGVDLLLTYRAGDGNDIALFTAPAPVPLPAALPMLIAGLGAAVAVSRRRRPQ